MKTSPSFDEKLLFTEAQFHELRNVFSEISGNKLESNKRVLLESRLRKLVMDLGVTPAAYIDIVKKNSEEQKKFITALTTHKTDWFREQPHFDFLKRQITAARRDRQSDYLVWSAACSTGEEIYSLLMTFLECGENRVRLLGTDISEKCVRDGSNALYSPQTVHSQVPADLIKKYFLAGAVGGEKRYKFNPEFQNHLKWRQFNLINSDLPTLVQFDYILLRNVLIYFEPDDATEVIRRLLRYLKPGGHFIVGLSETVMQADSLGLKRVENSVYRKV